MFYLKVVAVVAVGIFLLLRAARGPQKQFARIACLAIIGGIGVLSGNVQQGDIASWVGALLILGGLSAAIVMVLADMQWTVCTGRMASRKRNQRQ